MSDSGIPYNQVGPEDQLDPEERTLGLTHADQLRDLVAVVRARRAGDPDARPSVGSADGRRVLALILGMYESARTDRPVRLA
jgi:UDP-N-acetyl-2-amino-2-deoxyglucuronate dehydrogenase